MGTRDPRIDAYIERSAEFARPVLAFLREVVHEGCPDVDETMKWSMPHFTHHGMLCGMAAFKEHCTFGFWKGTLVVDAGDRSADAMGQFGCIRTVRDLPATRVLVGYVRHAAHLNEAGVKVPRAPRPARADLPMPAELTAALRTNRKALAAFDGFAPSHRRDYIEWIADAKREDTRARRVSQAVEWIAEGKPRNWKYTPKPAGQRK